MTHRYNVGDIVRIRQDYLPSAYADQFARIIEIRDDFCQVCLQAGDGTHTTEVIQLEDIGSYVDDAITSKLINALYVWGEDQHIDLAQFHSGSCAIAVLKKDVEGFLNFCDAANIVWSDGVQASKFNPYIEYDKLGAMGPLHCLLRGMETPTAYCIFAMTKEGLSFMFSELISDCITDSRDKD